MKLVSCAGLVMVALMSDALGDTHLGKVETIFSPDVNRDCFFFTLVGVPQADFAKPNDPWFAVPRTHPGFKEIVDIVLAASSASRKVEVQTTGALACGLSGVNFVSMKQVGHNQEPFQIQLKVNDTVRVPLGRRLVIEFVSVYGNSEADDGSGYFVPRLRVGDVHHVIAVTTLKVKENRHIYAASQAVRAYVPPDTEVKFDAWVQSGGVFAMMSISGFFEDTQ